MFNRLNPWGWSACAYRPLLSGSAIVWAYEAGRALIERGIRPVGYSGALEQLLAGEGKSRTRLKTRLAARPFGRVQKQKNESRQ